MKIRTAPFLSVLAVLAQATTSLCVAADGLPSTLLASKAPQGAVSVVEARKTAKAGDAIVVRGRIGGREAVLVPRAAIAVIADEKAIVACNAKEGDSCKIPWDYCCETPEKIKASIATIQVRDEKGKVVRVPLRGLGDLKELSTVVVAGTVDVSSNKDVLVINATAIHVEKP